MHNTGFHPFMLYTHTNAPNSKCMRYRYLTDPIWMRLPPKLTSPLIGSYLPPYILTNSSPWELATTVYDMHAQTYSMQQQHLNIHTHTLSM